MLMYNKDMGKGMWHQKQQGFTIIEVMLVLALSGLLFVGLIAGFSGSLARQRYKDATNDVVAELRNLYSLVSNTQVQPRDNSTACYGLKFDDSSQVINISNDRRNVNRGRSECVVYGVVATIVGGNIEITQVLGKDIHYVDDLIESGSMSDLQLLKELQGNNIVAMGDGTGVGCQVSLAGELQSYKMKWGSSLKKGKTDEDIKATLLIFRSPRNGSIRTYVWNDVVKTSVSDDTPVLLADAVKGLRCDSTAMFKQYSINTYLDNFKEDNLVMCIEPGDGMATGGKRRMLRVLKYGHSPSAIELVDADTDLEHKDVCK